MNADETEQRVEGSGPTRGRFLVIGYGNPLLGDDGVGPLVVEALEALTLPGLETRVLHQLTPELALEMASLDTVVFVDAVSTGGGRARGAGVVEVSRADGVTSGMGWSGHRCSPQTLLQLARAITGASTRGWIVGIPGYRFDWGFGMSLPAREGVANAIGVVRSLWEAWNVRSCPRTVDWVGARRSGGMR